MSQFNSFNQFSSEQAFNPTPQPQMRDFLDVKTQRQQIFDNVKAAISSKFPMENDRYSFEITDLEYDSPKEYGPSAQKEAVLKKRNLDWKLVGNYALKDKISGEVISQARKTIARVPYLTDRGTFIYNGNDYSNKNQQRLRPGVYTRRKANEELEAHVSLIPGTGSAFRIFMEPETGLFKVNIGQANIPAYTLLKALGVDDGLMKEAWGKEIFRVNAEKYKPADIDKVFSRLANYKIKEQTSDPIEGLKLIFDRMNLDRDIVQHNLGIDSDKVTPELLVRTMQKLLHIQQGTEEEDNRDSQANQMLMSVEDLLAERISKDAGGLGRALLWQVTNKGSVEGIKPGYFTKQLESYLHGSGLASPSVEVNPLELLDIKTSVTRMGPGGIPSTESIPIEARSVQNTQLGLIDPVRTPESLNAGVDTRLTIESLKGSDGQIYVKAMNPRTGEEELVSGRNLATAVVAFPKTFDSDAKTIPAVKNEKIVMVPKDEVDYVVKSGNHMMSPLSNLIPGFSGVKAGRLIMGSRMLTQALPLENPEAPLVRSALSGDPTRSYEQEYGKYMGSAYSAASGVVTKITPDFIEIAGEDGQKHKVDLYNNLPSNQKTMLHNTPIVNKGDRVAEGQLIAKSNFTDNEGNVAVGTNLRVGFLPFKGNYEDGMVISESAAKRLTSEHLYTETLDLSGGDLITEKSKFKSVYPGKFTKEQLDKIGDDGIVLPGSVVNQGDPLILAFGKKEPTKGVAILKQKRSWNVDNSVTWEHESPGEVTDIMQDGNDIKVAVKSFNTMKMADKLSNRYGSKGVISSLVPDSQMPVGEDGKPLELILNPLAIITRVNPVQIAETILGKVARKRGEPYNLPGFTDGGSYLEFALEEARKHGMSETETVFDPTTGRQLKDVLTGEQFIMKLHHEAESKASGRGDVGGYTFDQQPSKGGYSGSKRVGGLETSALLAHGAVEILKDAKLIRGQKNDDFWRQFRMGGPVKLPKESFIYNKFLNSLRGAGVNVEERPDQLNIFAMTSADVKELAGNRSLKSGDAISLKSLEPVKGGLFDLSLTGGMEGGNRWSKIDLTEKLPNPIMEEPIRRILDLTKDQFYDLLQQPNGATLLADRLATVNVDAEMEKHINNIKSGKKSKRDSSIKTLGFLKAMKDRELTPSDFLMGAWPVLPPKFRPVAIMDGMEMSSDVNYLYKDLFEANKTLSELKNDIDDVGKERVMLYDAMKAVAGLGEPINTKTAEKSVSGILQHVFGKGSPKFGMIQRKLLSNTVDVVGRAVITSDNSLSIDEVGLPENVAWDIYRPFIIRELSRRYNTGQQRVPMTQLAEWVANKDDRARDALLKVMDERPVVYSRAPALHKYSVLAARPKLVEGNQLRISPSVTPGLGADFDGNCVDFDTEIICKLSRSVLQSSEYGKLFLMETQKMFDFNTDVTVGGDEHFVKLKIGDFPRYGTPTKDKNGADVYSVPSGVEICTYDHEIGRVVYSPITSFIVEPQQPSSEVSTRSGKKVIVSNNESLCVYDHDNGGLTKISPKDAVDRYIPVVRKEPINGTQFNSDIGWFYGLFVSDGWVSGRIVGLAKLEDAKRDRFVSIARKHICDNFTVTTYTEERDDENNKLGDSAKIHMSGKDLVEAMFNCYDDKGDSDKRSALFKRLPAELLYGGNEECLIGLLSGLLDGDGTLTWNTYKAKPQFVASFGTSSPGLRDDVVCLCRKLGIRVSITTTPPRGHSNEAYSLQFSIVDLYQYADRLVVSGSDEVAALEKFKTNPPSKDDRDIIPIKREFGHMLATLVGCKHKAYSTLRDKKMCATRAFCINLINELGEIDSDDFAEFKLMVDNTDVVWEKVKEVEDVGMRDVFDFEIPRTKIFMIANGLIVYDTMNFHVPVSDEAVREAYEKLLPSRNLLSPADFQPAFKPTQEFLFGLYNATREPSKKKPRVFADEKSAMQAMFNGELELTDPIIIQS